MRYIKQKNDFSCGPIAILNAMKWQGHHVSYADYPSIAKKCRATQANGTLPGDMARTAAAIGARRLRNPSFNALKKAIKGGAAAIVLSKWMTATREGKVWTYWISGHYSLVTAVSGRSLHCANISGGHGWIPSSYFSKVYFQNHPGRMVWLIKRKNCASAN